MSEHQFSYRVKEAESGQTAGYFLKAKGYSRQILVRLKRTAGGIRRNGVWIRVNDRLGAGDRLDIRLLEELPVERFRPMKLVFDIVYEDEHLLVVNKPAGMPVHPSVNHYEHTLANAVMAYAQEKKEIYPYRCINRLDRDTTGLLIIAKHMLSAAVLYGQMREKKIRRIYLALVTGEIDRPGVIDLPIGRKAGSVIERTVDMEHGERAVTHYFPLQKGDGWTLVQCMLDTGRTHQIRVHMSHIGHPLPGDFLYGPQDPSMKRQPLHSWKLIFTHPITKERMEFTQPLPEDMKNYMRHV